MAMTETVPPSLNKLKLADRLAAETGLARNVAYQTVETLFDIMARTVATGGSVSITNFASIERIERRARRARNPQTGEIVEVPPRNAVKFSPSPRLVEFANSPDPSVTTIRKKPKKVKKTGPAN